MEKFDSKKHLDYNEFKSGFIAFIGRPNAGKSTLTNALVNKKVAITSDVVQTTRYRLQAIINRKHMQAIIVDTPGYHKPHDCLGAALNDSVEQSMCDVDIVAVVIDSSKEIGRGDKLIIDKISNLDCPKLCVLSKVDLIDSDKKIVQVNNVSKLLDWDYILCLSAKDRYNLEFFEDVIYQLLPVGPMWFPKTMITDQNTNVIISEYIRESAIKCVYEEIPHAIFVSVDEFNFNKRKKMYKIFATIFVETESQSKILIGKKGWMIKKIGTNSRLELEKFFSAKVYLDLSVKVKKKWRQDLNQIQKLGYGEMV